MANNYNISDTPVNVVDQLNGAAIPSATVASGDKVLFQDINDSDNLKQDTVTNVVTAGGGGGSATSGVKATGVSTNQSIGNASESKLFWNAESYDDDSWHDTSTNNDRLTVPSGVTRVALKACVPWQGNATGIRYIIVEHYNSSDVLQSVVARDIRNAVTSSFATINAISAEVNVSTGDYFSIKGYQDSTSSINFERTNSYAYFSANKIA